MWRRLLRVPWTARRSNQSILKEISPGISLEGMMLKLKLQSFGHLMRRVDSLEKTLMLGGIEGKRRRGQQRMRWLDGITDSMEVESEWTLGVGAGQGGLACCDSWGHKQSDTTERLIWSDIHIYLKNPPAKAGDACLVPGLKRSSREGNGYPHPVLLPGESHGQRNLAGYNPWGCKELDTTEDAHDMTCISIYASTVPSELHLVFVWRGDVS